MQQVGEERGGVIVERVCVAGLRLRFSFSPRGSVLQSNTQDALQWFLTSLGATLTEVMKQSIDRCEDKGIIHCECSIVVLPIPQIY